MLGHIKPYVEKHSVDAELAGHAHKLDMKQQRLCGSGFSLFAVCMLAKPYYFSLQQHFMKTKVGYISLPFECQNKLLHTILFTIITSYYHVILKMVTWHDAIKAIENVLFDFLKKRTKVCFSLTNPNNCLLKHKTKTSRWVVFFWKNLGFSQPCVLCL